MSVVSIQRNFNDQPQIVNMSVTDTQATIAATGWLNLSATIASITAANNGGPWVWQVGDLVLVYSSADNDDVLYQVNSTTHSLILYSTAGNGAVTLPVVSNDFVNFDGTLGALKDSGYSPSDPAKTKVVMAGSAVQVNYIAHFIDTAGTIDDTAANIQNDGNIQAGKSGVAGSLISFPVTASEGSLILAAVSNAGGNFTTTISNASSVGQSQVISIPDSGGAAANFILSATSGSGQTIASGNLIVSQGNVQAGSSGHAGTLGSFPSGASSGELLLAAVTNGSGNFNTTISNASAVGQSQVVSIPDSGSSTANFIISKFTGTQHITVGSLEVDGGNVLAGISGAAGNLTSFPAGATSGKLILAAVTNSSGDFNTTISNASAVGQSQVVSIPDGGSATSNFIISNSAGTQTIATGSLALSLGNLSVGSSGHAQTISIFPTTAANGTLILAAGNAGGAFNTTVTSGTIGQSTVYTIPDILASTGGIVVSTAAVRMKSVAAAAAAGGAATQSFTDTFCTTGSNVIGNWNTQANAVSVFKIVPGNGSFVVTSSADAGVGTFNYVIMK